MPTDPPEPRTLTDADPAYRDAVCAAQERYGNDAEPYRVTRWILAEMVDTLLACAFAAACDDCAEAKMPHPQRPGPGEDFAARMRTATPDASVVADAERTAAELLAAILVHYDPAPALLRWEENNEVSAWWRERAEPPHRSRRIEAAARCWGHYAVMEALGHGVTWGDDNAPLLDSGPPDSSDGAPLCSVGNLPGCNIDDVQWSDAHTCAAWEKLEGKEGAS